MVARVQTNFHENIVKKLSFLNKKNFVHLLKAVNLNALKY